MVRRWFIVLAAASLVLCAVTCVLWAISYTEIRVVSHHGRLYAWGISHPPGVEVRLSYDDQMSASKTGILYPSVVQSKEPNGTGYGVNMNRRPPNRSALGGQLWFGQVYGKGPDDWTRYEPGLAPVQYWVVAVPHWWIAATFASPSVLAVLIAACGVLRKRTRTAKNRCPSCGYDLRATPDRCPECGVVPAKS